MSGFFFTRHPYVDGESCIHIPPSRSHTLHTIWLTSHYFIFLTKNWINNWIAAWCGGILEARYPVGTVGQTKYSVNWMIHRLSNLIPVTFIRDVWRRSLAVFTLVYQSKFATNCIVRRKIKMVFLDGVEFEFYSPVFCFVRFKLFFCIFLYQISETK